MRYFVPMWSRVTTLIAVLFALTSLSTVLAQRAIADLLPDTTVLAVELEPQQFDLAVLHGLLAELDTAEAERVWGEYAQLLSSFADSSPFESSSVKEDLDEVRELFIEECPALWEAAEAASAREWSAGLGVSVSRFDPEPDLLFVARAASRTDSARVLAGLIACFDGRRYGTEGDTSIYLFADGSELPLLVAEARGALVASSDPDLLRGALRRAGGSVEPSLSSTRIADYSARLEPAGLKVTLNLAAVAEAMTVLRSAVPAEAAPLFDRFSTTLRVVNGVAWAVSIEEGGFEINTVSAWDAALAEAEGEDELLALLSCAECALSTSYYPPNAVTVGAGAFSLEALVDWADSWLADLGAAGMIHTPMELSVRSVFAETTGVDLDTALLSWLGGSYQQYTTDVYDTDLTDWLMGVPSVATIEVTSEEAARQGVRSWLDIAARVDDYAARLMSESGGVGPTPGFEDAVSVRELDYQGVPYLRVRSAPNIDLGVAVVNDHLVIGSPASSLLAAIDGGRIGMPIVDRAARLTDMAGLGETLQGGELVGYSVIHTPAFLQGLARLAELASTWTASGLWFAGQAASYEAPNGVEVAPPTYDDALVLTDLLVEALELLADKVGMTVGTSSIEDDARWSSWRLTLVD